MSQQINLSKSKYNKGSFNKRVDTSFSELKKDNNTNVFNKLTDDTSRDVNKFFALYNELFYDIPKEGNTQSHEFLIKESAKYVDFKQNEDIINSLRNEIDSLRQELLNEQQRTADLLNSLNQ